MKKKILTLVLAAALIITGVQPVFATTSAQDDKLIYSAIGDSVTAGYGVEGAEYDTIFVTENYYQAPELAYSNVVKKGIGADIAYNLGTLGAWAKDFAKLITDPNCDDTVAASFGDVDHMLHHLLIATLKKSDVISIELGGNDIMQGLILHDLLELGIGDGDTSGLYTYIAAKSAGYDVPVPEIKNPAALCACLVMAVGVMGGLDNTAYGLGIAAALLSAFADQIDENDIKELLDFFEPKSFAKTMNKYSEEVAQAYRDLIELLENGKEITEEEYNNLVEHYANCEDIYKEANGVDAVDDYVAPEDEELGKMSDLELMTEGQLSLKKCYDKKSGSDKYYIEPINPNAKLLLVGTYNPFGSNYVFKMKDAKEISNFVKGIIDSIRSVASMSESGESFDIEAVFESLGDNDLPPALIYGVLGFPMEKNFESFNALIEGIAKEYNAKNFKFGKCAPKYDIQYVSIIDLISNGKEDVHPNGNGHNFIGKQIIDKYFGTQAAAAVNNETYPTLAEAIAAAENGDTVLLLRNVKETVKVNVEKKFFLDKNGYALKGTISADKGFKNSGFFNFYNFTKTKEKAPVVKPAWNFKPAPVLHHNTFRTVMWSPFFVF